MIKWRRREFIDGELTDALTINCKVRYWSLLKTGRGKVFFGPGAVVDCIDKTCRVVDIIS